MAKQLYKGPPTGMLSIDQSDPQTPLNGWRYSRGSLYYTFWRDKQGDYGQYPSKVISLWWNGARWVVWIGNLFVGESTEFKNVNDPPMEWAESMYILVNN